jgi:Tol biopolymer transport system component
VNRIARTLLLAALAPLGLQATSFSLVSQRSDSRAPSIYTDGSNQPAITSDGRYVAFIADAPNLVTPNATGAPYQVYLRDRVAGTTELVSVTPSGAPGNASSSLPSISDDGCKVAFMSSASDLVAGDSNGVPDVFVRNRCAGGATSLASVSSGGVQANAESFTGRISADGRKVVFTSYAANLVTMPGAGSQCLYLRDLTSQVTSAITTAAGQCIAADSPDLSRDGSRVVFWSLYAPGTSNVVNGVWQIYLYDFNAVAGSQPVLVSTNSSGVSQGQGGEGFSTITAPAISTDGGFVAFRSRGSGLVAVDGGGISHVYIKEIATGAIVRASVDSSGNRGNADSSGSGAGLRPGLSRLANTVTFVTNATNLAAATGGFFPNVVAHNFRTGQTIGFSAAQAIGGTPAIADGADLIAAYSSSQLDAAFASRGMFVFSGVITNPPRLVNIATRMQVLTGDNVLIGGFIVSGSAVKTVVVRARGPSLTAFGVPGALANPVLNLYSGQTVIASNDDFGTAANVASLQASGFAPSNPQEAAILMTLNPGPYTAIVSGAGGGTGVGIIEVFEVDALATPLINIATRGQVLTGDNVMIGGFIIQGSGPHTVVVRARGPSLTAAGVPNALANPVLNLYSGQTVIASNDNWQTAANAATLQSSGFAPSNANEAAILMTLNPGAYTAIVSGAGGGTGVAIVEVFAVP